MEKTHKISVRLTEKEAKKLEELISQSNMRKSAFIRKALFNTTVVPTDDLMKIGSQLGKIGGNINQMSKMINHSLLDLEELNKIKENHDLVTQELLKALRRLR